MARLPKDMHSLRPWDAASYMLSPVQFSGTLAGNTLQKLAVPVDPNRIILAFSLASPTGNMLFGPTGLVSITLGMQLTNGSPIKEFTWWEHGPIVGFAWDISSVGATQVIWNVYGWSVNDWPEEGDDPTADLMAAARSVQRPPVTPPAPAVNGRVSASGYWARLLQRLRGG